MLAHPGLEFDANIREKPDALGSGVLVSREDGRASQGLTGILADRERGVPPAHPHTPQPGGMLSGGGLAQGPRTTLR